MRITLGVWSSERIAGRFQTDLGVDAMDSYFPFSIIHFIYENIGFTELEILLLSKKLSSVKLLLKHCRVKKKSDKQVNKWTMSLNFRVPSKLFIDFLKFVIIT